MILAFWLSFYFIFLSFLSQLFIQELAMIVLYLNYRCGQIQSGSFLDVAAPNGLFGLGMEKISVPSMLSREGFTADSFSMCFGHDAIGRISFGDKGSFDQDETPFNLNPSQ